MLAPRCLRCGQPFEPCEPRQRDCTRCIGEVARIIEQDARRRVARYPAKDLSGWTR